MGHGEFLSRLMLRYESYYTKVRKMSGGPLLKYNTGGWCGLYSNITEMQFHRERNAPSGYCKTILLHSIGSARRWVWHLVKVLVNILSKQKLKLRETDTTLSFCQCTCQFLCYHTHTHTHKVPTHTKFPQVVLFVIIIVTIIILILRYISRV